MPQGVVRDGVYQPTDLDRAVAAEVERRNLPCLMLYPPNTPVQDGHRIPHCLLWMGHTEDAARVAVRH